MCAIGIVQVYHAQLLLGCMTGEYISLHWGMFLYDLYDICEALITHTCIHVCVCVFQYGVPDN